MLEGEEIAGIPRLIDAGQIQDIFSVIQLFLQLRDAFEIDNLNRMPAVWTFAWQEQKSVAALLAMLYLDVKHMCLGPTIPAFLSSNVFNVLTKYFGLTGIKTVQEDVEAMLGSSDQLIRPDMIVSDIVEQYPHLVPVMMNYGLHCIGCGVSQMETLGEACLTHGLDVYDMLDILNEELAKG